MIKQQLEDRLQQRAACTEQKTVNILRICDHRTRAGVCGRGMIRTKLRRSVSDQGQAAALRDLQEGNSVGLLLRPVQCNLVEVQAVPKVSGSL